MPSWRAHPTRFVSMPAVLPMSLPAGSVARDYEQRVARAITVAVLGPEIMGQPCYWARWSMGRADTFGAVMAAHIDWSTTL